MLVHGMIMTFMTFMVILSHRIAENEEGQRN
jgi:hypothetical protein